MDIEFLLAVLVVYMIIMTPILIVLTAVHWKMFSKAGLPGWAAIVPYYNIYTTFKMLKMSQLWWIALVVAVFIPFGIIINVVVGIFYLINLYKAFGTEDGQKLNVVLHVLFGIYIYALSSKYIYSYEQNS